MLQLLVTVSANGDGIRTDSSANLAVKIAGREDPILRRGFVGTNGLGDFETRCIPMTFPEIDEVGEIEFFRVTHVTREGGTETADNWTGAIRIDALGPRVATSGQHRFDGDNRNLTFHPDNLGWSDIGTAADVVAMAVQGGRLYAATSANRLMMREATASSRAGWRVIGHANDVIAMTAIGTQLFAQTRFGRLAVRDATDTDQNWSDLGVAVGIQAIAGVNGRLLGANATNRLLIRGSLRPNQLWLDIGHANDVASMTEAEGQLYAVTRFGRVARRSTAIRDENWTSFGELRGAVALAGMDGRLFMATSAGRLLTRAI